jgi:hypothetical protein
MCTAVDGGSIHRAATRISAASDQRSTTPMPSHRTRDRRTEDRRTKGRRKPLRTRVSGSVSGFSVTLQDNSAGWLAARSLWPISCTIGCTTSERSPFTMRVSHSWHFRRLRRDRQSPQGEAAAAKPEDSHADARRKMFLGSPGCWASAAEARQAQPASGWP